MSSKIGNVGIDCGEVKLGKNRLHIDLYTTDAEAQRIERLGATRFKRFEEDHDLWIVLEDPEGNQFCVCQAEPTTIELL